MARCPNCGVEVDAGMKFCGECGAKMPAVKKCPKCGAEMSDTMKFCGACGCSLSEGNETGGGGISLGDKNVIAGDVTLTQNIIHEDETKKVVSCGVCGRSIAVTDAFRCAQCGKSVCHNHYVESDGLCARCHSAKVDSAENEYRKELEIILEDGIIDQDEFEQLEELRKKLGISAPRAMALQNQMKTELKEKKRPSHGDVHLMTVEKAQCQRACDALYGNGDAMSALRLISSILGNHPFNEEVLSIYLSALMCSDPDKVQNIVAKLPFDIPCAYLSLVDVDIRNSDLASAEVKLAEAERRWPENTMVKCRRVALMYATAKVSGDRTYLAEAMDVLTSLPAATDKLQSSFLFFLQYAISKLLGDVVPQLSHDYCRAEGLYNFVASGAFLGLASEDFALSDEGASDQSRIRHNVAVYMSETDISCASFQDNRILETHMPIVAADTDSGSCLLKYIGEVLPKYEREFGAKASLAIISEHVNAGFKMRSGIIRDLKKRGLDVRRIVGDATSMALAACVKGNTGNIACCVVNSCACSIAIADMSEGVCEIKSAEGYEQIPNGDIARCIQSMYDEALVNADLPGVDKVFMFGCLASNVHVQELLRLKAKAPVSAISENWPLHGAAYQAAIIGNSLKDVLLLDVNPSTAQIELAGSRYCSVIVKNDTIPTRRSIVVSVPQGCDAVPLNIYEEVGQLYGGVRLFWGSIRYSLLNCTTSNFELEVVCDIDANKQMVIQVSELHDGVPNKITVPLYSLSPDQCTSHLPVMSCERAEKLKEEGIDAYNRGRFTIARDYFEKATAGGNANAMRNLAIMYEKGHGVVKNHAKAVEWLKKAAEAGSVDAKKELSTWGAR